jgi:hypothetical protein
VKQIRRRFSVSRDHLILTNMGPLHGPSGSALGPMPLRTKVTAVAMAVSAVLVVGVRPAEAHTQATVDAHCIRNFPNQAYMYIGMPPGVPFLHTGRKARQKVFFRANFYQHFPMANQGAGRTEYLGSSEFFHNFLRRNQVTTAYWYNRLGQLGDWRPSRNLTDIYSSSNFVEYELWWYQRGSLVDHDVIRPWHDFPDGSGVAGPACAWTW